MEQWHVLNGLQTFNWNGTIYRDHGSNQTIKTLVYGLVQLTIGIRQTRLLSYDRFKWNLHCAQINTTKSLSIFSSFYLNVSGLKSIWFFSKRAQCQPTERISCFILLYKSLEKPMLCLHHTAGIGWEWKMTTKETGIKWIFRSSSVVICILMSVYLFYFHILCLCLSIFWMICVCVCVSTSKSVFLFCKLVALCGIFPVPSTLENHLSLAHLSNEWKKQ